MKNDLTTSHAGRIALIILAVLLGGVIGFVYGQGQESANFAEDNTATNITSVAKSTATPVASAKPTVAATPTPTSTNPLVTNTFGHFTFELPSNNYVTYLTSSCEGLCGNVLTVAKKQSTTVYTDLAITLSVLDYGKAQTIAEWNTAAPYTEQSTGTKTIGGVTANKYLELGLFNSDSYRFVRGNFTYYLKIDDRAGSDKADQKTATDLILSSFKFTN